MCASIDTLFNVSKQDAQEIILGQHVSQPSKRSVDTFYAVVLITAEGTDKNAQKATRDAENW